MNRRLNKILFTAAAMAVAGFTLAQTTSPSQPSTPPSTQSPTSPSSSGGDTPRSEPSSATKSAIKDCVTRVQAQNPKVSTESATTACERQMSPRQR